MSPWRSVLRWFGITLAGLLALIILAVIAAFGWATYKLNRVYEVPPRAIATSYDVGAIDRGEHLVRAIAGCTGCHGDDMGGMVLLDDPMIMTLYGPNLTRGDGGAASRFTDEDWDRAIRHGVGNDGKPFLLMPAQNFRWMTDDDLAAVVAYIRSLDPVDNVVPNSRLGPMGYLLVLTEPAALPAEGFDHSREYEVKAEESISVEYGNYLVWLGTCRDCHGDNLSGRQLPLPDEPPSRNLTPGGELAGWSKADFIQTVRTGITPAGDRLREPMADMILTLQEQSDEELTAIYLYLQSVPAREFGEE
jgi:mono/diheme cytochrome c family protein